MHKTLWTGVAALGFALMLSASPAQAHGWGHHSHKSHYRKHYHRPHHHGHYHRHGRGNAYGKIVIRLPGRFAKVVIGGRNYYHCDGVYYRKYRGYFEEVPSPYGRPIVYGY